MPHTSMGKMGSASKRTGGWRTCKVQAKALIGQRRKTAGGPCYRALAGYQSNDRGVLIRKVYLHTPEAAGGVGEVVREPAVCAEAPSLQVMPAYCRPLGLGRGRHGRHGLTGTS